MSLRNPCLKTVTMYPIFRSLYATIKIHKPIYTYSRCFCILQWPMKDTTEKKTLINSTLKNSVFSIKISKDSRIEIKNSMSLIDPIVERQILDITEF